MCGSRDDKRSGHMGFSENGFRRGVLRTDLMIAVERISASPIFVGLKLTRALRAPYASAADHYPSVTKGARLR